MTSLNKQHTLVIDIGKTHVKVHVLDNHYESVFSKHIGNTVVQEGLYPSADVDGIWQFFQRAIKEATSKYEIDSLSVTTHGATAALIDSSATSGNGLVLPVLDYEFAGINELDGQYNAVRPAFDRSYSPSLPAGLNLGRQLYWLQKQYPEKFDSASHILMYPQYWVWRFTGYLTSEITSLGCHTDLWDLPADDFSSLVDAMNCRDKFPALEPAWQCCGTVTADISESFGLSPDCKVYSGLHDSNASFLRYRLTQENKPFTVISSGTWTILMASQVAVENLEPSKDMLANIDALGTPIACARFMGGREFGEICQQTGAQVTDVFTQADIQAVIDNGIYALPNFSGGSGPFSDNKGEFVGDITAVKGIAVATMYCALMVDYQLSLLAAQGDIYVEGAFLKNPLLCELINQLRQEQDVYLSMDDTGTVSGTAYLANWENVESQINTKSSNQTTLTGLAEYKANWLKIVEAK